MRKHTLPRETRLTRDEALMATAFTWAQRGTCSRLYVGAVFSIDGRILAQGYNGSPSGMPHCTHNDDQPCMTAVHAEANGIAFCAKHGVEMAGAELHVTNLPCLTCGMLIVNAGICRVVYAEDYRIHDALSLFRQVGISVTRFDSISS